MITVLPTKFLGPSFEGFVFILKSDSDKQNPTKPNHTLTITSQTSIDFIIASEWEVNRRDRQAPRRVARAQGQPHLGEPSDQLHERHDASDFETKTQDKIGARG
jgi:hypothetical protein